MDLHAEKTALIKRLEKINDVSLIRVLKHMVDFGLQSSEERISLEQYNKELDQAEGEMDQGEFYTQNEVEKMAKKW